MAIRLAGFEVRTQLTWVFGSGFPKGNDIGRAIDLSRGGVGEWNTTPDELEWCDDRDEHIGQKRVNLKIRGDHPVIYTPADPEAAEWKGWNTQLKPAHEPICLARKPCSEPTVAANVLKWRTGALNIGACRVPTNGEARDAIVNMGGKSSGVYGDGKNGSKQFGTTTEGRYPATLIHDGSDAVGGEFPVTGKNEGGRRDEPGKRQYLQTGPDQKYRQGRSGGTIDGQLYYDPERDDWYGLTVSHADSGSAARYFNSLPYEPGELDSLVPFRYCGKASPSERNAGLENFFAITDLEIECDFGSFTVDNLFLLWAKEGQKANSNGDALPPKDTSVDTALLVSGSDCSTALFGRHITAQSLVAIRFTTLTGLKLTIESKILNCFLPLNTKESIQDAIKTTTELGLSHVESAALIKLLKTITTKDPTAYTLSARPAAKGLPQITSANDALRVSNFHSTVKPIRLMEWLCNLLTPPGGTILDPFMGSGTTGIAAGRNGFDFIGCDLDPSYVQLATERIAHWTHYRPELQKVSNPQPLETTNTPTLF